MAMFGWDMLKTAEAYARASDQKRLAESAMRMLATKEQNESETCPTEAPSETFSQKIPTESMPNFGDGQERRRIERRTH
jgi:hypothetical protein